MAEEQFLAAAVDAAKSAGEIIRKSFYLTKNVEHKGQVDLVTETDKACEDLIFNHLRMLYPDHKFIGEETSAALGSTDDLTYDPTWIVDPLDGTTNFVHGHPKLKEGRTFKPRIGWKHHFNGHLLRIFHKAQHMAAMQRNANPQHPGQAPRAQSNIYGSRIIPVPPSLSST